MLRLRGGQRGVIGGGLLEVGGGMGVVHTPGIRPQV
jgi:hypothetical protein